MHGWWKILQMIKHVLIIVVCNSLKDFFVIFFFFFVCVPHSSDIDSENEEQNSLCKLTKL